MDNASAAKVAIKPRARRDLRELDLKGVMVGGVYPFARICRTRTALVISGQTVTVRVSNLESGTIFFNETHYLPREKHVAPKRQFQRGGDTHEHEALTALLFQREVR
jgi:hypothetical protein